MPNRSQRTPAAPPPGGLTQNLAQMVALLQQHGAHPALRSALLGAVNQVTGALVLPWPKPRWAKMLIGAGACLLVVVMALAIGRLFEMGRDLATTLQYGDPRTSNLTAAFGLPVEAPNRPSLVTAVNHGGDVILFVVCGGKPDQTLVFVLPDADPTGGRGAPVLSTPDLNGDGYPDLAVQVTTRPAGWFYVNDGTTLRPPTQEEVDKIQRGHQP